MRFFTFLLVLAVSSSAWSIDRQGHRDGEVRVNDYGGLRAWDDQAQRWVSIEIFWRNISDRKGGFTWGIQTSYPDSELMKDGDTLLLNLRKGACLMEYKGGRWHRANDLYKWDDQFNTYGGCPYVFDKTVR